ncbi:sugar phosphate isomerase/epimerase [Knoellia remsis]|uniref:Sugar phosphate isomerase/epimerase n=1 Tax=Knoellia remsis TaxID=407159 RepID=A0A2T0UJG6_9MICO|nr:TIM barrel protein [Knoellia remsis]PRY58024.1 sugar phosphate isomerase/epimerase [Knoellia remsis]
MTRAGADALRLGLCSVTFRALTSASVARAARAAGLAAVEWGADHHAPASDLDAVRATRKVSEDAGLAVASYGSYWRAGVDDLTAAEAVVHAARELGAPRVRVWAGASGTDDTDGATRARVVDGLREFAELAAAHSVVVGTEFHGNTLTDSADATLRLLDDVGHPNLQTYWQPRPGDPDDVAVAGLGRLLDEASVCGVHAFSWWPTTERLPLDARATLWQNVIGVLGDRDWSGDVLLEFVPDDDPAQLVASADSWRTWAGGARCEPAHRVRPGRLGRRG